MAANIRFLYDFDNDSATITSSSEVSTLPDDNVVNDLLGKKWRTTGDSSEWIKFDLGSAKQIKEVGIFGHNLTSGATVTLEANATDDWASPSYQTTLTYNADRIVKFLDETYRWWRITFADASNPDGYIEVGRIVMGSYFEPSYNITNDFNRSLIDPSEADVTDGQQTYWRVRTKYWKYTVRFRLIPVSEQDNFETMFASIGNTEPVVVSLDPDTYPSKWSIYAQMSTPLNMAMTLLDYADLELEFEEKL